MKRKDDVTVAKSPRDILKHLTQIGYGEGRRTGFVYGFQVTPDGNGGYPQVRMFDEPTFLEFDPFSRYGFRGTVLVARRRHTFERNGTTYLAGNPVATYWVNGERIPSSRRTSKRSQRGRRRALMETSNPR